MSRICGDKMMVGRWKRRQVMEACKCRRWLHSWWKRWLRKLHRSLHWQVVNWDTLQAFFQIHKHRVHTKCEHFH